LLAHALPDGTFSLNDATAVAADRRSCAEAVGAGAGPLSGGTQSEGAARIVCARLEGQSIDQVIARIDKDCRGAVTGPCVSAPAWREFARAVPPFAPPAAPTRKYGALKSN
jgi:hypothetical protein